MLNFHARKKIKLVMLGFGIFLSCLVMAVGIYAVTNQQNSQFNLGINYQPEYLIKVELGVDGANGGAVNQAIETGEYVEIYNSTAPVGTESFYIQSISADTISLVPEKLTPTAAGLVFLRITSADTKDLQAKVICGASVAKTGKLVSGAPQIINVNIGVTASETAKLGAILLNIKFEKYIPILTSLAFETTELSLMQGSSFAEVQSKMNALVLRGAFEGDAEKALALNTDYTLTLARTDGGGTGAFNTIGTMGTITATAVSNTSLKSIISLIITPYTVFTYAAAERPVQELTNLQSDGTGTATNWYEHYIEMGEYPQTYYGATLPKAETEYTITPDYFASAQSLYEDKTTGAKFAKKGANFYNVEPVKWIVMGVTDGVLNGTSVLFTTNNKTANLWQYNSGTNTFQYRTNAANAWTTATEVLVLSEYSIQRSMFKASGYDSAPYYNHFSQSDATKVLNTNTNSLYNTLFTANQQSKIVSKTMPVTSYYQKLNSSDYNTTSYKLFLLGSRLNNNGSSWGLYSTDSYNISTYFAPENNRASQGNLLAKETSFSVGSTVNSPNGYGVWVWWLRSGYYDLNYYAMIVDSNGYVNSYHRVYEFYTLRPAFVLNLA